MAKPHTLLVLVLLGIPLLAACPAKKEAPPAVVSIACSSPEQMRCTELPQPSAEQRTNLTVECGSVSGHVSSPAGCPTTGFVGKCTVPAATGGGPEIRRWYKAEDAAYQKDFCVSTAKGAWSTTF